MSGPQQGQNNDRRQLQMSGPWAQSLHQPGIATFVPLGWRPNQVQTWDGTDRIQGQGGHSTSQQGAVSPQTVNASVLNNLTLDNYPFFKSQVEGRSLEIPHLSKASDQAIKLVKQEPTRQATGSKRTIANSNDLWRKPSTAKIIDQLSRPTESDDRQREIYVHHLRPKTFRACQKYFPAQLPIVWRPKDGQRLQMTLRLMAPMIAFVMFEWCSNGCRSRGICVHYSLAIGFRHTPDGLVCGVCEKAGIEEGFPIKRFCPKHYRSSLSDITNVAEDFLATPEQRERAAQILHRAWDNDWAGFEQRPENASRWEPEPERAKEGKAADCANHNEGLTRDVQEASCSTHQNPTLPTGHFHASILPEGVRNAISQQDEHPTKRARVIDRT